MSRYLYIALFAARLYERFEELDITPEGMREKTKTGFYYAAASIKCC